MGGRGEQGHDEGLREVRVMREVSECEWESEEEGLDVGLREARVMTHEGGERGVMGGRGEQGHDVGLREARVVREVSEGEWEARGARGMMPG
jgi:hypothetical protein